MSAINLAAATVAMAQYFSKDKRQEIFEDLIEKSKINNLIVMIDDLDRCTPERVIETLEAIKLFLSVLSQHL